MDTSSRDEKSTAGIVMPRGLLMSTAFIAAAITLLLMTAYPQQAGAVPGPATYPEISNGSFDVSVLSDGQWVSAGELRYNHKFEERVLDLSSVVSGDNVTLRIEGLAATPSYVDSVLIGDSAPSDFRGPVTDAAFALHKLSQKDYDVIDMTGSSMVVEFRNLGASRTLSMAARIEPEIIGAVPFEYPVENIGKAVGSDSKFYTYKFNSSRSKMTVDGDITNESLGEPIFKVESYPITGHPANYTLGWVENDDENLYIAMDFLPDDTMDGDKDFAMVHILTPSGVRDFKVSVPQQEWGYPAFMYTERAGYQHKTYEFKIPLDEIGYGDASDGDTIQIAFSAYGTAAAGLDFGDAPAPYPTLIASAGPSALIDPGGTFLWLGDCVDGEIDGQPSVGADGDDLNLGIAVGPCAVPGDDEDGITFNTPLVPGLLANLDVLYRGASGALFFNAFIDFNANGNWLDAGEHIVIDTPLVNGVNNFIFPVPAGAALGNTYARFTGGIIPGPNPLIGEIEDYQVLILVPAPEMDLYDLTNTIPIADGDLTPSLADGTDYGAAIFGSPVDHTFVIRNTGNGDLNIGLIAITGANPGDFSVVTPPAPVVPPASSTNIVIRFDPTDVGLRSATFSIANDDADENPYDFAVQGTADDGDGIDPAVEDGAPNGGDGNNDATPDRIQPNVASLPTAVGGGYVTVENNSCNLTNISTVDETALPVPDPENRIYPYGLVQFRAMCASADIVTYWPDLTDMFPRKTNQTLGTWFDFGTIAGNTIASTVADGGPEDNGPAADSLVDDPAGPAGAVFPLPTTGEWGLIIFIVIAGIGAALFLRRRTS